MPQHEMTHRERVAAALAGEPVDFLPTAFWAHNFLKEGTPADLAEATVGLAASYDFDFVKVQTRFSCYAECWGSAWGQATSEPSPPVQTISALEQAGSVAELLASATSYGPLAEQVEGLKLIRKGLPDTPILMTVFSPLMAVQFLLKESPDQRLAALELLRSDPAMAAELLSAITEIHARFAEDCVRSGADGIFYASDMSSTGLASAADLDAFEAPYGPTIFSAVSDASFNMIHLCGPEVELEWFSRYPAHAFSWDVWGSNPSLLEGREMTGKAVIGGVSAKPALRDMDPDAVRTQVAKAVSETEGRGLLLAPGCSVNWDTPSETLAAIRESSKGHRQ